MSTHENSVAVAPDPGGTSEPAEPTSRTTRCVALLGNPNVGKTTLYNRLAGGRQRTSNFPGTTQDAHIGELVPMDNRLGGTLVDLPGTYSLRLGVSESEVCRLVLEGRLAPPGEEAAKPDVLLLVLDATNLRRNLTLAAEALALGLPAVVAISMTDTAERRGIRIDFEDLARRLGVPVVPCSGRTGRGVVELRGALDAATVPAGPFPHDPDEIDRWAATLHAQVVSQEAVRHDDDALTDRLDGALTHPIVGVAFFAAVMTGLFWVIFRLATYPMDWIDALFGGLGGLAAAALPEGAIRDLMVEGVIAGVGATVIFLPQIVLLFFLISILEQTGYLARAALVIDRLMRPFGLSGHAFVPMLSGHACALPGIMAARAIPDRKDRLAAILVLPFMSCTARIPVYVLLTGLLFPGSPGLQALAFTGCYALGIAAGMLSALAARRTILRGKTRPMAIELPTYRPPSLVGSVRVALGRGGVFVRKAGTMILAISIVLWWLGSYPKPAESEPEAALVLASQPVGVPAAEGEAVVGAADEGGGTYLARIGGLVQPVFAPLGADRQLTIGILASFAAREVFVTTMAVQVIGTEDAEEGEILDALAGAERSDGTPIFNGPTSWALLVYFVLAMQCLPTLVVTAREAGGLKWAGLQLGWMTLVAYGGGAIAYGVASALG